MSKSEEGVEQVMIAVVFYLKAKEVLLLRQALHLSSPLFKLILFGFSEFDRLFFNNSLKSVSFLPTA